MDSANLRVTDTSTCWRSKHWCFVTVDSHQMINLYAQNSGFVMILMALSPQNTQRSCTLQSQKHFCSVWLLQKFQKSTVFEQIDHFWIKILSCNIARTQPFFHRILGKHIFLKMVQSKGSSDSWVKLWWQNHMEIE